MRRTIVITVSSLALSGLVAPAHAAGPAPGYTVLDLGSLAGTSIAYAISDATPPVVAGWARDASGAGRAFVWTSAAGIRDIGSAEDGPMGVDTTGRVVGTSSDLGAFVWTAGSGRRTVADLGGGQGAAYDVHVTAGVVGSAMLPDGSWHAFRTAGGSVSDLGTLGGRHSGAYAVNAAGVAVGYAMTAAGEQHAVLWDPGTGLRDLGTLGRSGGLLPQAVAQGVNSSGLVVGYTSVTGGADATRAFVHDGTAMRELGALPVRKGVAHSWAFDVNDRGQVVGMSNDRAVLFQGGKVVDLNTQTGKGSGWLLRRAYAVNEAGWIVGYGTTQGQDHAFLLVPR